MHPLKACEEGLFDLSDLQTTFLPYRVLLVGMTVVLALPMTVDVGEDGITRGTNCGLKGSYLSSYRSP